MKEAKNSLIDRGDVSNRHGDSSTSLNTGGYDPLPGELLDEVEEKVEEDNAWRAIADLFEKYGEFIAVANFRSLDYNKLLLSYRLL